jgi:hypothetical protein
VTGVREAVGTVRALTASLRFQPRLRLRLTTARVTCNSLGQLPRLPLTDDSARCGRGPKERPVGATFPNDLLSNTERDADLPRKRLF